MRSNVGVMSYIVLCARQTDCDCANAEAGFTLVRESRCAMKIIRHLTGRREILHWAVVVLAAIVLALLVASLVGGGVRP